MKRVLYTGLNPRDEQFSGLITHLPLIQIVAYPPTHPAIQQALHQFSAYTHVIITSKSTVPLLAHYLAFYGYFIEEWQKKVTIAVGQATARQLREFSIDPLIVAQEEHAEGIIKELEKIDLENSFFFWPHSAQARSVLIDFFENRKGSFVHCPFYDTTSKYPESIPNLQEFDEIVFTSPSTVKAFLSIFGMIPRDKTLTCIGPVTEQYLAYLVTNSVK